MKKNIIYSVLLALAALGFASCSSDSDSVTSPDEVLTPIRISAAYEGSSRSTTRVAYTEDGSNISATWQEGDQLYVCYNGHVNTLSLSGGAGTATATFTGTIQGTPTSNSILICYVRDANNPSAVSVNDNGEYTYAGGTFTSQDGTLAGAAKCNLYYGTTTYGTGEDISCSFQVNTSMLKFTVYAPDGVSAGTSATLTYKSGGTALAAASFTVGANGKNTIYITVPAGQYTGVQTLQYVSGSADESKTLSDTRATFTAGQTYSKTINFRPVPVGALLGKFTINSDGDKVYFSKGNLQYIGSADTPYWKFADNQWDYLSTNGSDATNVDRDLFGWGTSGWNNGNYFYQPYSTSFSASSPYTQYNGYGYGPTDGTTYTYSLTDDYANADWGVYNAISNGGNTAGEWRTLTGGEWEWILGPSSSPTPGTNCRTSSTISSTENARWVKATVHSTKGLIIFPDAITWDATSMGTAPTTCNIADNDFTYSPTGDNWSALESAGCVFLPAAGGRLGTSVYYAGSYGHYWSSTANGTYYAFSVVFHSGNVNPATSYYRYDGRSVRLVRPVE